MPFIYYNTIYCKRLNIYPTTIIPTVQIATNTPSNFRSIAFRSIIIEGKLNVVTAIMKLNIVPSCAPFASNASATGMVPKMSAYIGTPTRTAKITPNGFRFPNASSIHCFGIQLWITAPIPTPTRIYGNTFLNVVSTCDFA